MKYLLILCVFLTGCATLKEEDILCTDTVVEQVVYDKQECYK